MSTLSRVPPGSSRAPGGYYFLSNSLERHVTDRNKGEARRSKQISWLLGQVSKLPSPQRPLLAEPSMVLAAREQGTAGYWCQGIWC